MKLRKAIFPAIALSVISSAALAHEISGSAHPQHYTVYAGQTINVHSTTNVHVVNKAAAPKHFKVVHWCSVQYARYESTIVRDITLQPNQAYDEQNVDCYVAFTGDMHNSTYEFEGGMNITPDGEEMTQIRAKNYINVY